MPADVLVGRRLTIDALRSAVDAALSGVGGVVLVAGEAGMGKTGRIEQAHPELGQHLRASIVTGARCAYRPAETVRWSISQS